jgi:predicted MFS family arabinose efflux permease
VEIYGLMTGDEDARVCRDIPDAACRHMPANFLLQLISNSLTKIGDEIASARLVLAWLMAAVGAPAYLTGFLVPVRESGALLPQLFVAGAIRRVPLRKWFWVWGSVVQGACLAGMALAGLTLRGAAAGWSIIGLLAVFSLARGVCSVASKDVLGKTVSKTRRGTVMGYAAAAAGAVTVVVGAYIKFAEVDAEQGVFTALLLLAAVLWFAAAGTFALLREEPGATEGGGNAIDEALRSLGLLASDRAFRHFVLTRALLLSTALSLPFYVLLAREHAGGGLGALGVMLIAAGLAGSVSAPLWGRLADRSSRLVLVLAALGAGVLGIAVFVLSVAGARMLDQPITFAVLFLLLGVAHSGARLGRKTYLVDMADADTRAAYVAVSNTVIGVLMLVGGLFGVLAEEAGVASAILALAILALLSAASAWRLREVQG